MHHIIVFCIYIYVYLTHLRKPTFFNFQILPVTPMHKYLHKHTQTFTPTRTFTRIPTHTYVYAHLPIHTDAPYTQRSNQIHIPDRSEFISFSANQL